MTAKRSKKNEKLCSTLAAKNSATERNVEFSDEAFSLLEGFVNNPLMSTIKLARYKFVAKMLSKDDVVLDLGCGNGLGSYFFSQFAARVIGIDRHHGVDAASVFFNNEKITFLKGDILHPPNDIRNIVYSAMTMVDVIEHFSREDAIRIISSYKQFLGKGGVFIIGTPSAHSTAYRSQHSGANHIYEWTPSELNAICKEHFSRVFQFSMNDEVVHTGFEKLAWYFFLVCVV